MEAFRIYLTAIPNLAERVVEILASTLEEGGLDVNDAESLRQAHRHALNAAFTRLRDSRTAYVNVLYPHLRQLCGDCGQEFCGAYWEVANPMTSERSVFRTRLIHELIVHRRTAYEEPLYNLSGTAIAIERHSWNLDALLRVLQGLTVPPAVVSELRAMVTQTRGKAARKPGETA
ncbi:MAG: hypothetical protein VKP62_09770 [Candidatus Sericytochromatia bacterium]|nr:hypothetical protein [Candidatus Sericytochromatia bacterium]